MMQSLKHIFRTRYRIVPDAFAGYEAQFRHWYSPWWLQIGYKGYGVNTSATIERAQNIIRVHKGEPVYEE